MDKAHQMEKARQVTNDGQNRGPLPMMTNDALQFERNDQVADQVLAWNIQTTVLAKVFFHPHNIQTIQNGIRKGVYDASRGQYTISTQNPMELIAIMRSIYLQYAQHREDRVTQQVADLNEIVIRDQVPTMLKGIASYLQFSQSVMAVPTPLPLPQAMHKRGDRLYTGGSSTTDMGRILQGANSVGGGNF